MSNFVRPTDDLPRVAARLEANTSTLFMAEDPNIEPGTQRVG